MVKPLGRVGTKKRVWNGVHGCWAQQSVHAQKLWPLSALHSWHPPEACLQNAAHRHTSAAAITFTASVAMYMQAPMYEHFEILVGMWTHLNINCEQRASECICAVILAVSALVSVLALMLISTSQCAQCFRLTMVRYYNICDGYLEAEVLTA